MTAAGPPRPPRFRDWPLGRASNPQIGAKGGAGGGEMDGGLTSSAGVPILCRIGCDPRFARSARFIGEREKGSQGWSLSGGSRGIRRGWLGGGYGQPFGPFPSFFPRFLPFPPVFLREFRLFRFPAFFRIGTVFRTGTSVPSGAWVEPRLPRRPPRTVCLRRRSVATSLASISAVGDPVRLCGSGGFPGNGRRSVRSPWKGSVGPDGRRWRRHRSILGSC